MNFPKHNFYITTCGLFYGLLVLSRYILVQYCGGFYWSLWSPCYAQQPLNCGFDFRCKSNKHDFYHDYYIFKNDWLCCITYLSITFYGSQKITCCHRIPSMFTYLPLSCKYCEKKITLYAWRVNNYYNVSTFSLQGDTRKC